MLPPSVRASRGSWKDGWSPETGVGDDGDNGDAAPSRATALRPLALPWAATPRAWGYRSDPTVERGVACDASSAPCGPSSPAWGVASEPCELATDPGEEGLSAPPNGTTAPEKGSYWPGDSSGASWVGGRPIDPTPDRSSIVLLVMLRRSFRGTRTSVPAVPEEALCSARMTSDRVGMRRLDPEERADREPRRTFIRRTNEPRPPVSLEVAGAMDTRRGVDPAACATTASIPLGLLIACRASCMREEALLSGRLVCLPSRAVAAPCPLAAGRNVTGCYLSSTIMACSSSSAAAASSPRISFLTASNKLNPSLRDTFLTKECLDAGR